jgi:hypothetical protein
MNPELKPFTQEDSNVLEYEMVLLKNLYERDYQGPPKILTLERAADICGLNYKNKFNRSRLRAVFHRVLSDMFTPIIDDGKFTDSWEFYPNMLYFVDIKEFESCASDFYRGHPNGNGHLSEYYRPLKIKPKYKFVFRQKFINGKTGYIRI